MGLHVNTKTYTYTKTRLTVVTDQFELFFTCARRSESEIELLRNAIENRELKAVGVYIEMDGSMIAEVSLEVDWKLHDQLTIKYGERFNVDVPGWQNGVAPEPYVKVKNLVRLADSLGARVQSWIIAADRIRSNPAEHKALCEKLGYEYGSKVPPFTDPTEDASQCIDELEELKVTLRVAKTF